MSFIYKFFAQPLVKSSQSATQRIGGPMIITFIILVSIFDQVSISVWDIPGNEFGNKSGTNNCVPMIMDTSATKNRALCKACFIKKEFEMVR